MKKLKLIAFTILISAAMAPISFAMTECTNADGKKTFTNGICPQGYEGDKQKGYVDPDAPIKYGRYAYKQMLNMSSDKLHKILMKIDSNDPDFDRRYACQVESANQYHREKFYTERLENSTSLSSSISYTEDLVDAKTYKYYCK